jgi:hypothetical protein
LPGLPASSSAATKLDKSNIIPLLWLGLNCYFDQGDRMSFTDLLARCQYEGAIWKAAMLRCHFTHHCCHEKTEQKAKDYQAGPYQFRLAASLFSHQRRRTLDFAEAYTQPLMQRWLNDHHQQTLLHKFLEDEANPAEVLQLMRKYAQ